MDIIMKILAAVLWTAAFLWLVVVFDRKIAAWARTRWQPPAHALLYAIAFTPTAYHHAPNTIVAPLHLSTVCGNVFYSYEYTADMFLSGVVFPIAVGWTLLIAVFLFRGVPRRR